MYVNVRKGGSDDERRKKQLRNPYFNTTYRYFKPHNESRKRSSCWKKGLFLESIKSHPRHFAEEIRSRLKSTNASENLHKEPEKIRINSGGYFWKNTLRKMGYLHQKSPFQKMAKTRTLFQSQPREPPPPLPAYLPVLWNKKWKKLQNYWKVPSSP